MCLRHDSITSHGLCSTDLAVPALGRAQHHITPSTPSTPSPPHSPHPLPHLNPSPSTSNNTLFTTSCPQPPRCATPLSFSSPPSPSPPRDRAPAPTAAPTAAPPHEPRHRNRGIDGEERTRRVRTMSKSLYRHEEPGGEVGIDPRHLGEIPGGDKISKMGVKELFVKTQH